MDPESAELLRSVCQAGDAFERAHAGISLFLLGEDPGYDVVRKCLADPGVPIRCLAAEGLGEAEADRLVAKAGQRDGGTMTMSSSRRAALAGSLVLLLVSAAPAPSQEGDTQAKIRTSIETMIQAIEEGNDPMRNQMFFELRIIGNESVPHLVDLMKDERKKVREYAIHTVSYIDDARWIEPVMKILQTDAEGSTRAMACRALQRTQDTDVLTQDGRKAIPLLIEALESDEEEVVRMDAAQALGWFGDPVARPALEKAAGGDSELVAFFAKGALEEIDHAERMRAREGD